MNASHDLVSDDGNVGIVGLESSQHVLVDLIVQDQPAIDLDVLGDSYTRSSAPEAQMATRDNGYNLQVLGENGETFVNIIVYYNDVPGKDRVLLDVSPFETDQVMDWAIQILRAFS